MTLDEQIKETQRELVCYKQSEFSSPDIIAYLEAVLSSLILLKKLTD